MRGLSLMPGTHEVGHLSTILKGQGSYGMATKILLITTILYSVVGDFGKY